MLYDTIERLDTAIYKLNYILKAHKAYTRELLEDVSNCPHEIMKVVGGIEYVNEDIMKELDSISNELTNTMKSKRKG